MFEILSGGLDVPVEHDYTKGYFNRGDKPVALKKIEEGGEFLKSLMERVKSSKLAEKVKKDLIYRINKAESQYVSESQDNFRKYNYDEVLKTFIYDVFGNPERNKGKTPAQEEEWMSTRYRTDYAPKLAPVKPELENDLDEEQDKPTKDRRENKENNEYINKDPLVDKKNKDKTNQKSSKLKNDNKTAESKKKARPQSSKLTHKEVTLKRSSVANRQKRIDDLNKWTRWLADTSFQTYFGKPAFHTYGKNNTNPTVGGVVYGQYLLSHNVNPEHGHNDPQYKQVYNSAMHYGYKNGDRIPQLPRKGHEDLEVTPSELQEMKQRNPIMPKRFQNPDSEEMYTEGSDHEEDNQAKIIRSRNAKQANPTENINTKENKNRAQRQGSKSYRDKPNNEIKIDDYPEEHEKSRNGDFDSAKVASPIQNLTSPNQTPEPGSIEYKRMLEQFIRDPEYLKMVMQDDKDLQNMFPFCFVHNSYGQQLPNHELDPRNYKFLPSKYVSRIAPAGKKTSRGEKLYNVILPDE